MRSRLRTLVIAWLRRVAGEQLAADIVGDVAESGGGLLTLLALAISVTSQRGKSIRREPSGRRSLSGFTAALRHAPRSLRRTPWYSGAIIAVLAVTGALTTSGFAIVDGVLFRPLPIPDPDTLFAASGPSGAALSLNDLAAWRQAAPDAAIALYGRDFVIGSASVSRPTPLIALPVEESFLAVLGEGPVVGSWRSDDFQPGAATMRVMITDRLWHRLFAARPDVVGQPLRIAGAADSMRRPLDGLEVAGVLPAEFVFPVSRSMPDMLIPMAISAADASSRSAVAGRTLIRTRTAVPVIQARLAAAFDTKTRSSRAYSDAVDTGLVLVPIRRFLTSWQKDTLQTGFAACVVLMVLAIVNVSALSVIRAEQRASELGIRRALGATRADLFALAIADIVPLAAVGLVFALIAVPWCIAAVMARLPAQVTLLTPPTIDLRVLTFWLVLVVLTVLVSGILRTMAVSPVLVAAGTRGRNATATSRFGPLAVAAQVALALVIMVSTALIGGSMWRLWQEPIGYSLDNLWVLELSHQSNSAEARRAITMSVIDRVRRVPGVEQVAAVEMGNFLTRTVSLQYFESTESGPSPRTPALWSVTSDYFTTLGIFPIAGRLLSEQDVAADAPVAVISSSVAARFFPSGRAVGGELKRFSAPLAVVGVVPDIQASGIGATNLGQVYLPASRLTAQGVVLLVKGRSTINMLLAASTQDHVGLMRAAAAVDAFTEPNRAPFLRMWVFGAFATAALMIVAVGTFGLIAMSVARRTRELGIRNALGARRDSLVMLVVRHELRAVALGLLVGTSLAYWAVRFIKAYLYKTLALDPMLWAIAAATLLAVTGVAAFLPAVGAARVDPLGALRED